MEASLAAHLMIILGASERLSSSWPLVENISFIQRTRRVWWGYGAEERDVATLNTGRDYK